ncbi:TPA: hypothetical protein N0F65_011716 [Lagenidium giganteum]|uniref:Uncharacterized protein n=1 Tax=Lagenidium giganteum TaxID=4803 RepID=A0AAV2YD62_9STRA|nr:TPA: hypothetical protein N0F65_011716 [Lagenidium giganteum]
MRRGKFNNACNDVLRTSFPDLRIHDEAMRYLLQDMHVDPIDGNLHEALLVVFTAVAMVARAHKKTIKLDHLTAIIGTTACGLRKPAGGEGSDNEETVTDEDESEAELEVTESLAPTSLWNVKRVLSRCSEDRERRGNIPSGIIATLEKEQRALVRKVYIEDEAVEAGRRKKTH